MQRNRFGRPALAVLLSLVAAPLAAQVTRLPAVVAGERASPVVAASYDYPDLPVERLETTEQVVGAIAAEKPQLPVLVRPATIEWLPRDGDDGVGVFNLGLEAILPVPLPSSDFPLIVTPGFAVHYFDGPDAPDLPPRVFDAYAQFRYMRPIGERLSVDLALTPGVYSDFHQGTSNSLRVTGYGVAAWTATPTLKVVLGAAYVNRISTDVLPVCGLVWTPNDDMKYELVFPNPRIARRLHVFDTPVSACESWVYVAGEFGGGIWAIERPGDAGGGVADGVADGVNDVVDYTDFRVLLGISRELVYGIDGQFEVGYAFARKVRFESNTPDVEPDDTVMLRAGLTY